MPKFSDIERSNIEEDIYKKSKDLFITYGLKKTSIDDIVTTCNIGKGTFYTFFSSKEELYFKLLEKEHDFFENLVREELSTSSKPLKEAFKDVVKKSFVYMEKNPFIMNFFEKKELDQVLRKLPPEVFQKHVEADHDKLFFFVKEWQSQDILIDEDPFVLSRIFHVLILSMSYKEELGKDIYPKVINTLIDFVIDGMFKVEP